MADAVKADLTSEMEIEEVWVVWSFLQRGTHPFLIQRRKPILDPIN